MGVTRVQTKHGIKFRARISINGKRHNLGFHKTRAEALNAIISLMDREGIPYEETAAHQRQIERAARQQRIDDIMSSPEGWTSGHMERKIAAEFKPTFISRLLSKLRR